MFFSFLWIQLNRIRGDGNAQDGNQDNDDGREDTEEVDANQDMAAAAEAPRVIRMLRADGTIDEQPDIVFGPDWDWGNVQQQPEQDMYDDNAPLIPKWLYFACQVSVYM